MMALILISENKKECALTLATKQYFFMTRVRIPPGYKVLRKNIAMLLCVFDLICIVCVLKKRNKGIGQKKFLKQYFFKNLVCMYILQKVC
jgi:hypothetical protein